MRRRRKKSVEPKPEPKVVPPDHLPFRRVVKQIPCTLKYPAASSQEAVDAAIKSLIQHFKNDYILQNYRVISQSRSSVLFECLFLAPDGWQLS